MMTIAEFGDGAEFNTPPNTVISEAVFTANHLTDTDKQNSTGKYTQTKHNSKKANNAKLPWFNRLL